MMIPKTEDGRVLFAVPWHEHVMLGTTDTPVPETDLEPRALDCEIDFILRTAAQYLERAPTRADVLTVYAGLRPLVKPERDHTAENAAENASEKPKNATKSLSRSHTLRTSQGGMLTLTGGKWTTYRRMGQDTVNEIVRQMKWSASPSITENLELHGWCDADRQDHWGVYGADAHLIQQLPGADKRLCLDLPNTEAEVIWAVRYEQARTIEDVLARRIRFLFLNARAAREAAPRVAQLIAQELGHDDVWQQQQLQAFEALVDGYLLT